MREFGSWRVLVAGAVAAIVGGALAVGVAAHTSQTASELRINAFTSGGTDEYAYGAITSASGRCLGGRKVRVFEKRPGTDTLLGADISQRASGVGPYTVTAPTGNIPQGRYYAQVKRVDTSPRGAHAHICKGARSGGLNVGP